MIKKANMFLDKWDEIISKLKYPRDVREIYDTVTKMQGMSFEDFKAECENFYTLYLNMLDYTKSYGVSKSMTAKFNTVARILDLIGHAPELAKDTEMKVLLDYLEDTNQIEGETNMSEQKVASIKLNSNTISLGDDDRIALETILKKVASDNSIEGVENISISLTKEAGVVIFKQAAIYDDEQNLFNGTLPKAKVQDLLNTYFAQQAEAANVNDQETVAAIQKKINVANKALQGFQQQTQSQWDQSSFAPETTVPAQAVPEQTTVDREKFYL